MVGFYFNNFGANDLIFACKIFVVCRSDSDIIIFPSVQTEQNNVILKQGTVLLVRIIYLKISEVLDVCLYMFVFGLK